MYRDPRTDVATMAGATTIAVDKITIRARGDRLERTEGDRRAASTARWARRARLGAWARRGRVCRVRRAARTAAGRCARAAPTAARCARDHPSPLGGTAIGRSVILAPTDHSKGAGNTLSSQHLNRVSMRSRLRKEAQKADWHFINQRR